VGRKGVVVSDLENDETISENEQTDKTDPVDINAETYASISGQQIIELDATFEAVPDEEHGQAASKSNIYIHDNVEEIKDTDNAARVVQIAAKDTTYRSGSNNVRIDQDLTYTDPLNPVYRISVVGGEGGAISMTPVNPSGADVYTMDNAETLLPPLVISNSENGTYESENTVTGSEFYLNVVEKRIYTPDCISVTRSTMSFSDSSVPRFENFHYEVDIVPDSGLVKKPKDLHASNTGKGIGSKSLAVKPAAPIKVDSNGVGLNYDTEWFDLNSNGELTFNEAKLRELIEDIINDELSNLALALNVSGDVETIVGNGVTRITYAVGSGNSNNVLSLDAMVDGDPGKAISTRIGTA
jgi:hypothetical protein